MLAEKNLYFLIKKTPEQDLKKYGIPNTPSLRRQVIVLIFGFFWTQWKDYFNFFQMSIKASSPEQKVLCYVKALFDYDPYEDALHPCPEAGLTFQYGEILAVVNQDGERPFWNEFIRQMNAFWILNLDPNWWQARLAEDHCIDTAKLIPSRELEEKRKAFVPPEADYTTKIGLCGSLVSR